MHSLPIRIRIAGVLAERSRSAPHALEPSLAHGRRRPLSTPDRSRPRMCAQPPRLRRSLTIGSWYRISITISRLPRMVALGRSRVNNNTWYTPSEGVRSHKKVSLYAVN
eukprot:6213543-Pleurochrysis_carterae.AAC.2